MEVKTKRICSCLSVKEKPVRKQEYMTEEVKQIPVSKPKKEKHPARKLTRAESTSRALDLSGLTGAQR